MVNIKDRVVKASKETTRAIKNRSANAKRKDKEFRNWCESIVCDMRNIVFKINSKNYKVYIVEWYNNWMVTILNKETDWKKDIENKRFPPWWINLAELRNHDDLRSVSIRDIGQFHHYADLPEDKKDCYCRPENWNERAPEIKKRIEDTLVKFIEELKN